MKVSIWRAEEASEYIANKDKEEKCVEGEDGRIQETREKSMGQLKIHEENPTKNLGNKGFG